MLREGTAANHGALDARFAALVDDADLHLYGAFLRMNAAARAVLDPTVVRVIPAYRDSDFADLHQGLQRDIKALGLSPMAPPALPPLRCDVPEAAGVLYVLDGSRLGARFLLPRLLQQFQGDVPLQYLKHAASPHVTFQALERLAPSLDPADVQRTVHAARAAFDVFDRAAQSAIGDNA